MKMVTMTLTERTAELLRSRDVCPTNLLKTKVETPRMSEQP